MAIWCLAEEHGANISTLDIAERAQIPQSDIDRLFPHNHNLFLALIEDIRKQISLPDKDERSTPRDQIFDATMLYFDAAQTRQPAIKKIANDLMWSPLQLFPLLPSLYSLGESIVSPYIPDLNILRSGKNLAYNGVFAHTFHTFLEDDSFDLSKTMVTLDQGLKNIDDLCAKVTSFS